MTVLSILPPEPPGGLGGKRICLQSGRHGFDPWVRKIPWRRKWQPTPVLLPGESHGQRSLAGYSPWGHKESDMTEQLKHFHSIQVIWALPVFLLASLIASLTTWWIWSSGAYMLFLQILAHQQVLLLFSHSVMFESLQPHGLSITGSPVLHYLPEFAQTHVHWVCDAIQPSHSLLPSSPPTFNLSQH